MSAPKHTPGPWERRWNHTSDGERTVETGRIVHERFGTICHLVMADDVDANARLIAAAPELLEACKAAAERMDNYDDDPEPETSPAAVSRNKSVRAFRMLIAAIAKAEGR